MPHSHVCPISLCPFSLYQCLAAYFIHKDEWAASLGQREVKMSVSGGCMDANSSESIDFILTCSLRLVISSSALCNSNVLSSTTDCYQCLHRMHLLLESHSRNISVCLLLQVLFLCEITTLRSQLLISKIFTCSEQKNKCYSLTGWITKI